MLDAKLKDQLKAYMEKLLAPVEIQVALDNGEKSTQLRALLTDVAASSSKISLSENNTAERKPSFKVRRQDSAMQVHFAGIPMGHEFSSLILALLQAGGHPSKLAAEQIEQIKNIEGEYRFETYISLSCQNCPEVVQALNTMAIINPNISHVMIDGALFQDEIERRKIMAVPSVYMNGELFAQGLMGIEEILAKIDTGSSTRDAEKINAKEAFDVLIVGGGPAAAAAAIYAARKGIRTGVVAERFGGQVLDTVGIENFISVEHTEGPKLARSLEAHVRSYDVDIMNVQRARKLATGELIEIELDSGAILRAKTVVLATGARWREMNVPGEQEYRGKGVAYCPHCDGPLFKGKRVAVIGGGNSGVEAAIDLAGIVAHVTLLEFDKQMRADAVLQRKLLSLPNIKVITEAQTSEVLGDGVKVNGLAYLDRRSGERHEFALEGIFVQIGLLPNTDWLKDSVALSARGEIEVNARGETSVAGVFAAGDATTVPYKQIIIAMGEGSKAALSAFDYLIRQSDAPAVSKLEVIAA